mmetsp:Transcript_10526/g.16159  ORF Transcript_10526/g.16159 Transcript_10526/m.16159 type:complete len:207 (+) Transcript_10526:1719-2339(+)
MMLLATTALLSLPRFCSHNPSKSLMTVTKNRFSSSSDMAPEIEPIAQQRVLRLFHDHADPSTCSVSLASIILSVSSQLRCVRYTKVSLMVLYCAITSVSLVVSLTMSPFSSSTIKTSSGLAMLAITTCRTPVNTGPYMNLRDAPGPLPFCDCALPPPLRLRTPPPPAAELEATLCSALYKSSDSICHASRQILKISVSLTSETLTR